MNKAKTVRVAVAGRAPKKARHFTVESWRAAQARAGGTVEIRVCFSFATRIGDLLASGLIFLSSSTCFAAIHYVDASSSTPVPPYASWATAATTIQDAVDVSLANEEIVVTNGVYSVGGHAVFGIMTNRVTVDKAVSLRSVNGPAFTTIQGRQIVGSNGDGAIRCVYLATNASMSGFTIRDGATRAVGDYPREEAGGGVFCESLSCTLSNCVVTGNSAELSGGGVYGGTLIDCLFTANGAEEGGAAYGREVKSVLRNCTVSGNSAGAVGAGVAWADLSNCILVGNHIDNIGSYSGGGAFACTLNNCTVVSNAAPFGGGVDSSDLKNCIVYFNMAQWSGPNQYAATLNYCCTEPDLGGEGNITANPLFVDLAAGNLRLQPNSPCINLGLNAYVAAPTDLDGLPRIVGAAVDMGAYEFQGSASAVMPYFLAEPTNQTVTAGGIATFSAKARGTPPLSYQWRFNGTPLAAATNSVLVLDDVQLGESGNYSITITNVAGSVTSSNALLTVNPNVLHYVDPNAANPSPAYTNWATAALTIQDAIDVAAPLDEIVVNNGVYATGGKAIYNGFTNRVAVTKPVKVRSVNGPHFTSIEGYQVPGTTNGPAAIRCVYMTNGARLVGFTVTKGASLAGLASSNDFYHQQFGGGVWCESTAVFITNCVLTSNSAGDGGGAYMGSLYNCTLSSNTAFAGGGAYSSTLNSCTITGNVAIGSGGAEACTLRNCTVANNVAAFGGGVGDSVLYGCIVSSNRALDGLVCFGGTCTPGSDGGGSYGGTLNNSLVVGNSAPRFGGGVALGNINNCTFVGNSAGVDGGAATGETYNSPYIAYCNLNNCIAYYNSAPTGKNFTTNCILNNCCTLPLPPGGVGNLTNEPRFVDLAGGNLRLQSNSPCINAGNNTYVTTTTDLDGRPRISGVVVDMGAYEFQPGVSGQFVAWLYSYGLPTDGSADYVDSDGDGMSNYQEWRTGTNPTNAASVLRMISASPDPVGVSVSWQSVLGFGYYIQRSASLNLPGSFSTIGTNITGQAGSTSFTDTNAPFGTQLFYRVGVE